MQFDIRFPVMARVTKKGAEDEFRMLVSHTHRADIPEVSRSETETALPSVVQTAGNLTRVLPELRFHEGRLYRFLGHRSQAGLLLGSAFSEFASGDFDFVYSTNPRFKMDQSPVSRPIHQLYLDRLAALSMDGADSRNKTWPKASPYIGYKASGRTSLKKALDQVSSVNSADLNEAFEMHRAQADRLLVIGDSIWYETRPPCIEVDTINMFNTMESTVSMRYRYMPETMEQRPTSIFFPLSQAERAKATAEKLRRRYRMAALKPIPHKYESLDHPAFDFDPAEDIVHRTGQALLTNVLKHAIQRPDWAASIDAGWIAAITYVYHTDNHLIGKKADYSTHLPAIVECFLSKSWKKFTGGLAALNLPQLRKVLPVVVEMMDDLPISIPGLAPVHTLGK
ncbi:hypothetical protein GOB57_25160 [Sinorhizobium meliloti]|nr:hypothetical protein [Sinorhizobium meliloti]